MMKKPYSNRELTEVMLIVEIKQTENRLETTSDKKTLESFRFVTECAEENGLVAIVSWLKSIRLANLLKQMKSIDLRREGAFSELEKLTQSVEELIESNRGGDTGIHGFIGERAQVFLSNAWAITTGEVKICELIDDNGMTDYFERGIAVQQKACRSNGRLGLDQIMKHHEKYSDFHGKYQIPKDFYEVFIRIEKMNQSQAGRLSRHEWNLWHEIQKVKNAGIEIEPMKVTYSEIQRDKIYEIIGNQKNKLQAEIDRQTEQAIKSHKPTMQAFIKTAAVSSAVEGVLTGSAKVLEKRVDGKRFREFDKQDIKDIGLATVEGTVKGAVRGTAVYLTENLTPVPGLVAGGVVTVVFESEKAIRQYSEGNLSKQECIRTIGKSTLTASAGALGAKLVGEICPIPIVGEVVGGFLFSFLADKSLNLVFQNGGTVLSSAVPQPA